jgi:putative intracellular protease/amidase
MTHSDHRVVLIPVPHYGFDPTEAAVPWRAVRDAGYGVAFATPDGRPALADTRMVTGADLPRPLRKTLMARPDDIRVYRQMESCEEFQRPIAYERIEPATYHAILLPGGHDKGMRPYLESIVLQRVVASFFDCNKPVGAICHGTLLAARSRSVNDSERAGKSVLWGRRTTGLTRNQELISFWLTRLTLGDYYRTYDVPMMDDLISHLREPGDYTPGPGRPIPLARDSEGHTKKGFTVRDGNYLSARWPGDAHAFARAFVELLAELR